MFRQLVGRGCIREICQGSTWGSKRRLSVAVFGTDEFTVLSLKALHHYGIETNDITSIDVVTRPLKAQGRGYKAIVETPSAEYAQENGMRVLRAESDAEIAALAQNKYDLAVAVSYGSLIPATFLNSLKYCGLNVHPSLLPSLMGAAPLHRAIMDELPFTGVSVQTLHATKFDRGRVLAYSDEIPLTKNETLDTLRARLGLIGAQLLVEVIKDRLFEIPGLDLRNNAKYTKSHARKITKQDFFIRFGSDTVSRVLAKNRALGRLTALHPTDAGEPKRVFLDHLERSDACLTPGQYRVIEDKCHFGVADGTISASVVTCQGYSQECPGQFMKSKRKRKLSQSNIFTV
jgi:methionyl-tRNA formyltransferase